MKSLTFAKRFMVLVAVSCLSISVAGCVISSSPENKTLTFEPGDKMEFSAKVSSSCSMVTWYLSDKDEPNYGNITWYDEFLLFGTSNISVIAEERFAGENIVHLEVRDFIILPIPTGGLPFYIEIPATNIYWKVTVNGLAITPNLYKSNITVEPGKTQHFEAEAYPKGDYQYSWVFDGEVISSNDSFDFTPSFTQTGIHKLEISAVSTSRTFSRQFEIAVPHRIVDLNGYNSQCVLLKDGSYATCNSSESGWVLSKLNSNFIIEWTQVLGNYDDAPFVELLNDGTLMAIFSDHMVKLSGQGQILWEKEYPASLGSIIFKETSEGKFLLASDSKIYLLDNDGQIIWEKDTNGRVSSIDIIDDGGFIIGGQSNRTDIPGTVNHGGYDCYIAKIDSSGNIEWDKLYGGSGDDGVSSVKKTSDGGYILAGYSNSTDLGTIGYGEHDIYIIKLDQYGDIVWQRLYGGTNWDDATDIIQISGTGYMVSGNSYSKDIPGTIWLGAHMQEKTGERTHSNGLIMKIDDNGNVMRQTLVGGIDNDLLESFIIDPDNKILLPGIFSGVSSGSEKKDVILDLSNY